MNDYKGMRTLTADTRIRLSQIKELRELIEDAVHYEIGEISKKTGLQKCLINGRIVWLLPKQNKNFSNEGLGNSALRQLAKSAKKARTMKPLLNPTVSDARKYLIAMSKDWKTDHVICPFLGNARIRFNEKSIEHFFWTNGKKRPEKDVIERAECLPYIRDILERSGKPAEHLIKGDKESYSIVGRADINGKDRGIKVVITKHQNGNMYYFSVNSYTKM